MGFYVTYRTPKANVVAGDEAVECDAAGCEMPKTNKTGKRLLWVATGIAGVALVFPYLTPYLF